MIGRPREELLGQNPYATFPRVQGTPIHEAFERAMREQRPVTIETRVGDGRWFVCWYEIGSKDFTWRIATVEQGGVVYTIKTVADGMDLDGSTGDNSDSDDSAYA